MFITRVFVYNIIIIYVGISYTRFQLLSVGVIPLGRIVSLSLVCSLFLSSLQLTGYLTHMLYGLLLLPGTRYSVVNRDNKILI